MFSLLIIYYNNTERSGARNFIFSFEIHEDFGVAMRDCVLRRMQLKTVVQLAKKCSFLFIYLMTQLLQVESCGSVFVTTQV